MCLTHAVHAWLLVDMGVLSRSCDTGRIPSVMLAVAVNIAVPPAFFFASRLAPYISISRASTYVEQVHSTFRIAECTSADMALLLASCSRLCHVAGSAEQREGEHGA